MRVVIEHLLLISLLRVQSPQERDDLGTGAGIAGQKLCAAALHDALAQCPVHGGHRITGYGGGVRKAGDQVCQRHSVHPIGCRIAEQKCNCLCASASRIRAEGGIADTGGDCR